LIKLRARARKLFKTLNRTLRLFKNFLLIILIYSKNKLFLNKTIKNAKIIARARARETTF